MEEKKIVYGVTDDGLIFIPFSRADELAGIYNAINTAETWGELRESLPKEAFEDIMRMSDQYEGPWKSEDGDLSPYYIPDEAIFTEDDFFSLQGGYYPGHPEIEMSQWMPEDIQEKFGRTTRYYSMDGSAPKGTILVLDEGDLDEIIRVLEEKGFQCEEDEGLVNLACGYVEW